jgi:(5-formylfuran-3-yl)methyl phosphate synthase
MGTMRLMISVLSAVEAREAVAGGAEILDVKNPAEGSLGAQAPAVIREIKKLASGNLKVSAAIGDMPNLPGTAALAALGAAYCGADYVKVGLKGPRNEAEAVALLREVRAAVQDFSTTVIAGLYADWERAQTLNPLALPGIAAQAGIHGCLLDTAIKDGRSLFDFLDAQTLSQLVEQAHAHGLLFGLAGALHEKDLHLVQALGADIVGMRTAVCRDHQRSGPLEAARVIQLRRILVPVV